MADNIFRCEHCNQTTELLGATDIALVHGLSRQRIATIIKDGQFPPAWFAPTPSRRYWRADDVTEFFEGRR